MDARKKYYSLLNQNLGINEINELIDFKNECKLENNLEYFYLANLLIIDVYINEKLYNDALTIASRNFIDLDKVLYPNIYFSLLERYIYIYIEKKNFLSAYKCATSKRDLIDTSDKDAINRWYLEMAYIQDSLNEKSKALSSLLSILENDPTSDIKGIVLNNIAKLYIDNKDVENSKVYIDKSIEYANSNDDEDAKIYCAYLNAKLYELLDKNRYALKLYSDIFKSKKELTDEYIGYLNEYLVLLNKTGDYKEAKKVAETFLKTVESSKDLFLKKDFYSNYILSSIYQNKEFSQDFKKLYSYFLKLDLELSKSHEEILKDASSDELEKEVNFKLEKLVKSIEKVINIINYSILSSSTERDCLFEFSKEIEKEVHFNEAIYLIFNRSTFNAYPKFLSSFNTVSSFQYKKDRLYERELNYDDLNGSIVEKMISSNNDLIIDFNETQIDAIDPITKKSYLDLKIKYLYATPLVYENNLYACAIYLSNNVDLLDRINLLTLKIASRMLENKLVTLFYEESLRTQKNILQVAIEGLQEGIYYYDVKRKMLYLSDAMSSFLSSSSRLIKEEDYIDFIDKEDRKIYESKNKYITSGAKYTINYRLNIGSDSINIKEKGSPFFSKDGDILFYITTINKEMTKDAYIRLERKTHLTLLNRDDLEHNILNKSSDEFSLIGFKIKEDKKDSLRTIYDLMTEYSNDFYLVNDNLICLVNDTDEKTIKHYLKNIRKEVDTNICLLIYPKHHANIKNLITIIDILVNIESSDISLISDDIIKMINKKQYITDCVNDALIRDDFEVLYSKLYDDNVYFGNFIKSNVKGIENFDNVKGLIEKDILVKYELAVIKKVSKTNITFIPVSFSTINKMISDNLFDKMKISNKVYFVIDDINNIDNKAFDYLVTNKINYMFDYSVIKLVPYYALISSKGVCMINGEEDKTLTDFLNKNNKIIISDDYVEDCKFIYYEGIIQKNDE